MKKIKNSELKSDIKGRLSNYDSKPKIKKEYDNNASLEQPYRLTVGDESYFYSLKKERDKDYNIVKEILSKKYITVKILLDDFLEWRYKPEDIDCEQIIHAMKHGCKPIAECIKTSHELFQWTGYLPIELIKNIKQVKKDKNINIINNSEIQGGDFLVEFV